ncbi:hypothetical protein XPU_0256, partial [Xanthomonas arboricola pv. pruni str. MAFF 311562]
GEKGGVCATTNELGPVLRGQVLAPKR